MAHRTTWESPALGKDTDRRNPYRNQIDYILVRKEKSSTVFNSRSHNGLMTSTDHRLVRAKINMKMQSFRKDKQEPGIDIGKLKDPHIQAKYAFNVEMKMMDAEDQYAKEKVITAQEMWDSIVQANHQTAKEMLTRKRQKANFNAVIQQLSERQKEIHLQMESTSDHDRRNEFRQERNKVLTSIHSEVRKEKERKITEIMRPIEEKKDDSNRMYTAMRNLQRMSKKTPLVVDTVEGITTDTDTQINIITSFFKDMFNSESSKELEEVRPAKMREEFTEDEVSKAIKSLKNNKSPGIDKLRAEHLKCGPKSVHEKIAQLLNHIAETGDFPKEIKVGLLIPLQKPGKKKGPPSNLRPIILLSILRKVLAICLIRRIGGKIEEEIPLTQAAYRNGRGTTEQLFAIKILAEKAITTPKYETHLLMMDMSKAFDRLERNLVMADLKNILNPDELHLVKILIEDVRLAVKLEDKIGNEFRTNVGAPQGDCLSPILFTLYLARAMDDKTRPGEGKENQPALQPHLRDHSYSKLERKGLDQENIRPGEEKENHPLLPPHLRDHCYSKLERTGQLIPLQYADDICWLGINCSHEIERIKTEIPSILERRNLMINEAKTEEYKIYKGGDQSWEKCKYLGTLLDTAADIKKRKRSANTAMEKIKHIIKDKKITLGIKLRAFNAYVASIFLYNSESWTVSQGTADSVDSFHRKLLRKVLNVYWPRKMSNDRVYEMTRERPWSKTIQQRRLRFYGHISRMPDETPVNKAMIEYYRPLKMSHGAPKFMWKKNLDKDLDQLGISLSQSKEISQNRKGWRTLVNSLETGGTEVVKLRDRQR